MGRWLYGAGPVGSHRLPVTDINNILRVCLAILLLAACRGACAAEEPLPWTFNLYFENDLFGESDEQYTNGVRASWISPDLEKGFFDDDRLPDWVKSYSDQLRFFHDLNPRKDERENLQKNVVLSLGQLMYTPEDIDATEVVPDDRPYAGYLYFSAGYHTRSRAQLDTIEINLGVVGPWARGQEVQDFVHDARGIDKFQGWDNQLENELGLQAVYEHKHRVAERSYFEERLHQDVVWHAGFSLGNVATYLNVGAEYRIGLQIPEDFGTAALRPAGDSSAPGRGDARLRGDTGAENLHLFVSFDMRGVARDIFLDGNTLADSHSVKKRNLVYDVAAGLSFTWHRWKLSYAQIYRSREFKGEGHGHDFGSISISYTY